MAEQDKGGTATVEKPITKPTKPTDGSLPPWSVILHNDTVNTLNFVVAKVREIVRLNEKEAIERALEAHTKGLSVLIETHQERAEFLVEQFASHKITATAEPAAR